MGRIMADYQSAISHSDISLNRKAILKSNMEGSQRVLEYIRIPTPAMRVDSLA
jgi:hypothetical protein